NRLRHLHESGGSKALSKAFDEFGKAFIVGSFLPALLFALVGMVLFSDIPWVADYLKVSETGKAVEKLVYLLLGVWTLAVLMVLVNRLQYRLLEGYLWPVSKLTMLMESEKQTFTNLNKRLKELRAERKADPKHFYRLARLLRMHGEER